MNSGTRGQKKYAEKVEKASKVLLVCVYDTVVLDITNEIIRSKFEPFGKIAKMLIFQKGEVTKLFIQYDQIDQAIKARNKLDGTKLYESICKMTIYFSNFANVEVVNEPPELENSQDYYPNDFSVGKKEDQSYSSLSLHSGQSAHMQIDDQYIMSSFSMFADMKRSKTDNPMHLSWHIENMASNNLNSNKPNQNQEKYKIPIQKSWGAKKEEGKKFKIREEAEVRSSILWFGYRYPLKPKFIYNLFSNFGNISCIVIKKEAVYIKFRSKEFAAMASMYLSSTSLMGNVIELRECPEDSSNWKFIEGEFSESVYYDFSYDRFTSQRSITVNPPASTIHVSSIKRDICKQKNLRDIFAKYGEIQRIQILQSSSDKNMALIRFQSLEDSFNAIAHLHNENFSGRKMQISFTKSKL